jgi:RNA polymerase sigma factor (sigma-70 family)
VPSHHSGVALSLLSIEELYRRHRDALRRIVKARLPTARQEVIEDACQQAWLTLLETPPPRRDNLIAWLVTIAHRQVIQSFRREGLIELLTDDPLRFVATDFGDLADASAARIVFETAWWTLTSNQRAALRLWAHGYTYREIGQLLDRTDSWTRRHIYEGLLALRASCRSTRDAI